MAGQELCVMSSDSSCKSLHFFSKKESFRTTKCKPRTCGLNRRDFLRWLLRVPLLSFFYFNVRETRGAQFRTLKNGRMDSIAERFIGEDFVYEIGVGPLKRVALGKLSFNSIGKTGRYLATLRGETLGILGWVAGYRVDTYRSIMEEIDGGRRLRPLSFEEDIKIGSKVKEKIYHFNYDRRTWIRLRRRRDGSLKKREQEIPVGATYDDFLTASYNFRYGVYGKIERGKAYTVATFPQKHFSDYEVKVAGRDEEREKRKSEQVKEGKDFFVRLYLDPEITHSREGLIEGWLSKELHPTEGRIKDVMLFGDVKGRLIGSSRT